MKVPPLLLWVCSARRQNRPLRKQTHISRQGRGSSHGHGAKNMGYPVGVSHILVPLTGLDLHFLLLGEN